MITGQPMFNPSLASETRQQVWNATFVYRKISYLPAVLGIRVVSPGYDIKGGGGKMPPNSKLFFF
jgi:hypothetical protein